MLTKSGIQVLFESCGRGGAGAGGFTTVLFEGGSGSFEIYIRTTG